MSPLDTFQNRPREQEQELLEQRVARLEQLLAVGRRLNSTLEIPALLLQVVSAAREITGADAASILLVENDKTLRFAASCGPDDTLLKTTEVPIDKSLAGWVVRNAETAIVEDATSDLRVYVIDEALTTRSIVAVPMLFGEQVIGVLESLTHHEQHRFSPHDVEALETLAGIAAVAVQNARLFQQSDWIAEIVHEIRTPLTSIMTYADLLATRQLQPHSRQKFVEIINHEANRVNGLINQFLDLARLESGRVIMKRTPFSLAEVIRLSRDLIRPQADERQMSLEVVVPPDLPEVLGDAERIQQVLLNFLSNAVKYANPGDRISVACEVGAEELIVTVTDTGPGIAKEHQQGLFEKFSRVPGSEERAEGSGLGLNIARQIILAHQGRVWLESEAGEGSTFAFSLPLTTE
ncbi:MAG: ATP-binding protein [Anaerolineales bacterium]